MQSQELWSTILTPLQPADLVLAAVALVFCRQGPFDTVWDVANRVCDRYLPPASSN